MSNRSRTRNYKVNSHEQNSLSRHLDESTKHQDWLLPCTLSVVTLHRHFSFPPRCLPHIKTLICTSLPIFLAWTQNMRYDRAHKSITAPSSHSHACPRSLSCALCFLNTLKRVCLRGDQSLSLDPFLGDTDTIKWNTEECLDTHLDTITTLWSLWTLVWMLIYMSKLMPQGAWCLSLVTIFTLTHDTHVHVITGCLEGVQAWAWTPGIFFTLIISAWYYLSLRGTHTPLPPGPW